MPITPLHFGVMAPINHLAKSKVSNTAFVLINVIIDLPVIAMVLFPEVFKGDVLHGPLTHSFVGVMVLALLLSLFGYKSRKWIQGIWIGGISHIVMDMLVHPDMAPLYPKSGNVFYMGWMAPVSLVGFILMICWLLQMWDGNKLKLMSILHCCKTKWLS